jgi:Transposase
LESTAVQSAVFCGIDWAEDHHDVALVDARGAVVGRLRIADSAAGFTQLLALLAADGDGAATLIPVAIETPRGLMVACLRAGGPKVFAINPLAVARYRERHSVARKKSDAIDAAVLANILRTDIDAHRPLPADSELAQTVAVLARAQQDAVWDRTQAHNKLRSVLREFYPAILAAFATKRDGILRPEARMILAAAPTPTAAAKLTKTQLQALLAGPAANGASTPRPTACRPSSAPPTSTNPPSSKTPTAARRWRYCVPWTQPAPTPTTWKPPPWTVSTSTPTLRSSPAFQDSPRSPAPEC